MRFYNYDSNGLFLSPYDAQEDPLEKGSYIRPTLSTDVEPPSFTVKQTCKFVDGAWVVEDIPETPVIPLTIEEMRASMPALNRVQFVTVLSKHNLWAQAQTLADTLGIEAQVQFSEGQIFKRMDELLIAVAGKLALSDDQVDALFTEGYGY